MPKFISILLVVVALVAGVLIGNRYGRRDVVNSRPPNIEGQLGVPGLVGLPNSGYFTDHLVLKAGDGNILGGVSVLTKKEGQTEIKTEVWALPDGNYRLAIYNNDNTPIRELASFVSTSGAKTELDSNFATPGSSYFLAVIPGNSGDIILKSE